jgi:hypothetical protein
MMLLLKYFGAATGAALCVVMLLAFVTYEAPTPREFPCDPHRDICE